MGVPSGTKMKGEECDTTDSDVLSDTLITSECEEDQHDVSFLDKYVLDLYHGDLEGDELFMEEDTPFTSKDVIRDPLGEDMFSPDNITP
ncbi:hypothetical protein NDU88_006101 [Pleurodeles waltl]|uniref:Uncharacterized protein n=1 Tax=Pleurodeles waltl TaxID=8319 RepID=A0AAV7WWL6_PLEWA|nr:hypothetical protein NDU88_006101 [Pleurodeles waltl]